MLYFMVKDWILSPYNHEQDKDILFLLLLFNIVLEVLDLANEVAKVPQRE